VDVIVHEPISASAPGEKEFLRKDLSERAFEAIASKIPAPVL